MIDPPWNNSGCKLNYRLLEDKDWMAIINFDDLMDDGVVFLWVTSAKLLDGADWMRSKGFIHKETIVWNKVDRTG